MTQVRGWLAVVRKELTIYFGTPIFYITGFFFLLLAGYFFYTNVIYYSIISFQAAQQASNPQIAAQLNPQQRVFQPLFSVLAIILLFLVPFITMRLMAEEKRSGTAELLFTYPLTDWAVIAGKFGAALLIYLILLAFTVSYPLVFALIIQAGLGGSGHRLPRPGPVGGRMSVPGAVCLQPHREPDRRREWWPLPCCSSSGSSAGSRSWGPAAWGWSLNTSPCWTTTKTSPKGCSISVTWRTA